MFSNEFEFDESITTIMDEGADYEDVQVMITDEQVFIRQWDDDREKYEVVCMSPKMFYELQEAMNRPAGLFYMELTRKV